MRALARSAVKSEKNVGWTDQPVLVHRVKLDTTPVFEDFGAADQRDIVIMDNIESFFQNRRDTGRLEKRKASLLGDQRRKKPEGAREPVHCYVGVIIVSYLRVLA